MLTIQESIVSAMELQNMSQAELSRISGVSKSSLSRYLGGDEIPASKLMAIATALHMTIDQLLGIDQAAPALSPDELHLIETYRACSQAGRRDLLEMAAFVQSRHPLNQGAAKTA